MSESMKEIAKPASKHTNPPLGTPASARDIVQTIAMAIRSGYTPAEILDENSPITERIRAEDAALRSHNDPR